MTQTEKNALQFDMLLLFLLSSVGDKSLADCIAILRDGFSQIEFIGSQDNSWLDYMDNAGKNESPQAYFNRIGAGS